MTRPASLRAGAAAIAATAAAVAFGGAIQGASASATPSAAAAGSKALVGTFRLAPGRYAHGKASGTYFRMIIPGGKSYFLNPDSPAGDKTFTPLSPGTSGGLVTGRYQPDPRRAFDAHGNSRATAIVRPVKFAAIKFSLATLRKDPQSKLAVPAPSVRATGSKLTGQLKAFTAAWNKLYFNQGAPKPGASGPAATGTYDARTGRFVLQWKSLIKGGAFNGFTGLWHLQGTFKPARASAATATTKRKKARICVIVHKQRRGHARRVFRRPCKTKAHPHKKPVTPAPPAPPTGGTALVGTFKLTTGASAGNSATGSYFRMVFPGGSSAKGPFFTNPSSAASDKTFTLISPGTDGGLITGAFQEPPTPAFTPGGNALANRIIVPQRFAGVNFSLSTSATDPQTGLPVPAPSISVADGRLSGQVQAFSASWNKLYFNQGSPKPDGTSPGVTTPVSGTYDATTRAFIVEWTSSIRGGPFNGFAGYWHLAGTFEPKEVSGGPGNPLIPLLPHGPVG
jgi:hypothetical protein